MLTPEEMSHLTAILQKPVSVSNGRRSWPATSASFVMSTKRSGFGGQDPLAAAHGTQ